MSRTDKDGGTPRLLTRGQAIAIVVGVLIAGALVVWFADIWFDDYAERAAQRPNAAPAEVMRGLATQLRVVGLVNAVVVGAIAWYIAWYASRAIKNQSALSPRSVVRRGRSPGRLKSQPFKTGYLSARVARWMLGAAGILLGLGIGIAVAAWHIANRVEQGLPRSELGAVLPEHGSAL